MDGGDGCTRNDASRRILDDAGYGGGGDALRVRVAGRPQQKAEGEKSQRSEKPRSTHVFSMACLQRATRHILQMGCFEEPRYFTAGVLTWAGQKGRQVRS